ncbi:MAG TPA: S8 family serine peptidase, partial [Candidatus Limnocylindria bacterium]|nr:S8 family serine peptidase [Candidatus Limnocylindria bacterium]
MLRALQARSTRALTVAMCSILVLALSASFGVVSDAAPKEKGGGGGSSKLGHHDRELLATARANGESTVMLLIAAAPGQNGAVASAVTALGGTVRYREDNLDYLRVKIAIDLAERVAALKGVDAADVDEVIPLDDPRPDGVVGVIPQPAPGSGTPNDNPYMPTRDTKAAQFMAAHPTWDGRGVTIGIVDTGVSLDHPALQTTTTGERKIVGWVTGTDPFDDNDPTWVNMATQVTGPTFVHSSGTYTAPAAGSYRFGLFNERDARFGGELGRDANRDGNPAGSSGLFGVLWDTTTGQVWVDIDQDKSFADQTAMTDYGVNYDIGWFGTDDPSTAIREQLPFVVQTDGKNKVVNIGVVSGAHGTHVAGIAAANGLFGGAMTGAAPGAKIVSSRACLFIAGCTSHALVEGMIYVAKQANVDVINMSIGGLPALNDANNTRARIYDRLIEQYNVQMFISAGNSGPGINTVGDPSVATKVMSVGASITRDTYLADYGADPIYADNMLYFSSRGPREDGGFKPNIVAPGAAVSSTPMWQNGSGLPYTLPPGYSLFNGTSMAAPMATGSAALLISAAKATGTQHQPAQLRQAINSTTRFLDPTRFQAYDQGNGLMDTMAAWELLKTNIKTVDISGAVPVNTILSGFLATPGVGTGIYDREGVTAGASYTRTYTFRRTSGGGGTKVYTASWVGNDGTFSSPTSVALPLNASVTFQVSVNPAAGAHSAILNLDDPATAGIDYQSLNTVIAPYDFTAAGNYQQTVAGSIGPAQATHFFFRVPAGTPAFKVDMTGGGPAGAGAIRFL